MLRIVSVLAVLFLVGCLDTGDRDPEPLPQPVPCRTPAGTFTVSWALQSSTCDWQAPALPAKDETFPADECGVMIATEKGTYDNGCTYEASSKVHGEADGFTGTVTMTIDCSGVGGDECTLKYNMYFEQR